MNKCIISGNVGNVTFGFVFESESRLVEDEE